MSQAADHLMHCFRRWMTYEPWCVGCMNYLRPSLIPPRGTVRRPFHSSLQNACGGPMVVIGRGTGTVKDIFFFRLERCIV